MNVWFLIIILANGSALQMPVANSLMCGFKSQQAHYELMIEDRYKMGKWYCENAMTGERVTGKQWMDRMYKEQKPQETIIKVPMKR